MLYHLEQYRILRTRHHGAIIFPMDQPTGSSVSRGTSPVSGQMSHPVEGIEDSYSSQTARTATMQDLQDRIKTLEDRIAPMKLWMWLHDLSKLVDQQDGDTGHQSSTEGAE